MSADSSSHHCIRRAGRCDGRIFTATHGYLPLPILHRFTFRRDRTSVRTYVLLFNRSMDTTNARFGLHSAECSASPMIFSWINGPNARGRKEATREKSCEKRSSRTAHTVHDRPGENFDRSGQSEFQKGSVEAGEDEEQRERERVGGGSGSRASVARKIEKHLYAGTNVTHPLGCSELRQ